ncbi:hypothetical protein ABTY96_05385 [Streptomyces sp. NPDC096057]|uniref:hypothetical protein n=1 Tax=Streptomyces sp. NPDC096057 TaxID=3155543 RepID=UPI003326D989
MTAVGCAGSGDARAAATGHTTASSRHTASGSGVTAVRDLRHGWTKDPSGSEGVRVCGATAHQVVCATGADGVVGRSRADGAVTWTVPATGAAKNLGLVVDKADERAVTGGGRTLRAANLRTGRATWPLRLPADRGYTGFVTSAGGTRTTSSSRRWSTTSRGPCRCPGTGQRRDGGALLLSPAARHG